MNLSLLLLALAALPPNASKTVATHWPDAKILEVEVEKNGHFEVKLKNAEGEFEVTLDADGKVLGEERVVSLKETPAAVQKTIASWKGVTVERIERITEDDKVSFEVVTRDGKKVRTEVVLRIDGTEIKRDAATE